MLYVITGPPCVGKSTWVRQRAKPGDVVVDLDRIALAMTAEDTPHHEYPQNIRKAAMVVWRVAVDAAISWAPYGDSYLIHAKPNEMARARYHRARATFIDLDAPYETLMRRAKAERPSYIWKTIANWYDDPEE